MVWLQVGVASNSFGPRLTVIQVDLIQGIWCLGIYREADILGIGNILADWEWEHTGVGKILDLHTEIVWEHIERKFAAIA